MFYHKRNVVSPKYVTERVYLKDMTPGTKLNMFDIEWSLDCIEMRHLTPVYKCNCLKTGNSMSFRIIHGIVYAVIINAKTMDVSYKEKEAVTFGFMKRGNYYSRDVTVSNANGLIKNAPYKVNDFIDNDKRLKIVMIHKNYMVVHDNRSDLGIIFNKTNQKMLSQYGMVYIGDDDRHKYDTVH